MPDHLGADDTLVHAAFQTWLLRSEGRVILIDAGIGNEGEATGVQPCSSWVLHILARRTTHARQRI